MAGVLLLVACNDEPSQTGSSDSSPTTPNFSDAPRDASIEDFCELWRSPGVPGQVSDNPEEAREWIKTAMELGTPSDLPDDAREGFVIELTLSYQSGDTSWASLDTSSHSSTDIENHNAFSDWKYGTCHDLLLEQIEQ